MTHKIKFKGKTYTTLKILNDTNDIILRKEIVKDSKGNEFILVKSVLGYFLYDISGNTRISETLSISEWDK